MGSHSIARSSGGSRPALTKYKSVLLLKAQSGYRIVAIITGFQPVDRGSIPLTRSIKNKSAERRFCFRPRGIGLKVAVVLLHFLRFYGYLVLVTLL